MGEFQNSKVESLKYSVFEKIQHMDLLRDDLIHPIVCGNKWRKLKYAIEFIKANQLETIVTFGGAYSNHVIATAFDFNMSLTC